MSNIPIPQEVFEVEPNTIDLKDNRINIWRNQKFSGLSDSMVA